MSTQPPPPPPPPPLPPSPPPLPPPAVAPFHHKIPSGGLRTGLKPIGGILLGGALQGGSAVLVSFADRRKTKPTAQDLRGLGLMKAMRSLDSLRKHVVAEEEAETLGVSSGRIDVQVCSFEEVAASSSALSSSFHLVSFAIWTFSVF